MCFLLKRSISLKFMNARVIKTELNSHVQHCCNTKQSAETQLKLSCRSLLVKRLAATLPVGYC